MDAPRGPVARVDPERSAGAPVVAAPAEAAPGAGLADGVVRRLDPRYVRAERIGGAIFAGVLLAAGGAGVALYAFAEAPGAGRLATVAGLVLALVVAAALSAWAYPPLKYEHCTWRLSPFGLEIRRGVWWRHWISVPRARVQHTDVERGPLGRRFGLATLVVHTAGHQDSEVRLEGLEHSAALALRDYLLAAEDRRPHARGNGERDADDAGDGLP